MYQFSVIIVGKTQTDEWMGLNSHDTAARRGSNKAEAVFYNKGKFQNSGNLNKQHSMAL